MVSLLQDIQENDQRVTMLQLVDKMKVKNKGAGNSLALGHYLWKNMVSNSWLWHSI